MRYWYFGKVYLGVGALACFVALSIVVAAGTFPLAVDLAVTRSLQGGIAGDTLAHSVVLAGQWLEGPLVLAFLLAVLASRRWMALLLLPLGMLGLMLIGLLKDLVQQPRPSPEFVQVFVEASGLGFPSGGAASTVVLLGLITHFLLKLGAIGSIGPMGRRGVLMALAFVFVWDNLARLYSGRHWMTDTVGGWLFGFVWLLLLIALWRWWQQWSEQRRAAPEQTPVDEASGTV